MLENFADDAENLTDGNEITSLVVFIHGYQGTDFDLEKAKNFLTTYNARVYGLLIKSIQD